jgi:hypothetical protein
MLNSLKNYLLEKQLRLHLRLQKVEKFCFHSSVVCWLMIIGAVVLAAGESERTGQNKLLLRLNGKNLIDNILDALAAAKIILRPFAMLL